jgi:putative transposase
VRAHLAGGDDGVVKTGPLLARVGDFAAFLDAPFDEVSAFEPLRRAEKTGRPVGGEAWIRQLEREAHRPLPRAGTGQSPGTVPWLRNPISLVNRQHNS